MRRTSLLLAPVLVLLALALPTSASAAIAWAPCPDPGFQAFECGRLSVPLDRSGAVGGTVDLFARRLRAPGNASRTALVALAGGPGQAAAPIARGFATGLASGLQDRDLLVFDQRGTGQSGALTCPALTGKQTSARVVRACANQIGPRRGLYRTADTVADLEDLRREAGYDRVALFGVSYGTKVALDYAAAFPARVERMALDSVVPPEGPDPLTRASFTATRRILREQCAARLCSGATPDAVGDVRALVRRARGFRGTYVDGRGRRRRGAGGGAAVYLAYRETDLNPAFRALLPGAVRAARRGDESPLLRIFSQVLGFPGGSQAVPRLQDAGGTNFALNVATLCEDVAFPWDRGAGVDRRARQAGTALGLTPRAVYQPFTRRIAAATGLLPLCVGWPNATPQPAPPAPLPGVPTLELSGQADIRTPVEDARAVAGRIPSPASVVVVPNVGHSVLGSDPTECAAAAVAQFFGSGTAAPCAAARPSIPPQPRPARSVRALRPTAGLRGVAGRTLTAVLRTRDDALVAGLGAQLSGTNRVGGVRGGTIRISGNDVVLSNVQWVRGVRLSGTFADASDTAVLRVRGSFARGTLTFFRDGRVEGRLGGRRVQIRPVARTAAAVPRKGDWTGFARFERLRPLALAAAG